MGEGRRKERPFKGGRGWIAASLSLLAMTRFGRIVVTPTYASPLKGEGIRKVSPSRGRNLIEDKPRDEREKMIKIKQTPATTVGICFIIIF